MNHRSSRSVGFLITLLTAVSACGGGSDDEVTGLACGPGTREDAGRCVPDGSGGAGGSGAGGGAGAAGAGAGGEAGGGGGPAAGSAGASGASAGGAGGSAGGGAGGAAAGAGGAAAGAGGGALADDPCPSEPIDVNNSETCGPKATTADKVCIDLPAGKASAPKDYPFIVRTPAHPGVNAKCDGVCKGKYLWTQDFHLYYGSTSSGMVHYRITGGGKGWASHLDYGNGLCAKPDVDHTSCFTVSTPIELLWTVVGFDPNAPAVNFVVEASGTAPLPCP